MSSIESLPSAGTTNATIAEPVFLRNDSNRLSSQPESVPEICPEPLMTCPDSGGGLNALAAAGATSAHATATVARRAMRDMSEAHLRCLLDLRRCGEIDARLERVAGDAVDDRATDLAELGIVIFDRGVVLLARAQQPILGALELDLQIVEALVRPEVGIRFLDHHQSRQRAL